jgi:hypothetical protein
MIFAETPLPGAYVIEVEKRDHGARGSLPPKVSIPISFSAMCLSIS